MIILKIILLIITVGWLAFIFYLSHQSSEKAVETSFKITRFICKKSEEEKINALNLKIRMWAHAIVYFVFAVLVFFTSYVFINDPPNFLFVLILIVISVIDELTKIPIDGRKWSIKNMGLNVAGTLVGAYLVQGIEWIAGA